MKTSFVCGDWNLVLTPYVDTENYRHINNARARSGVLKLIDEDNDIDDLDFYMITKALHGRKLTQRKKQARLDFFLVSEESFELVYD